jgi:hypothetical protein
MSPGLLVFVSFLKKVLPKISRLVRTELNGPVRSEHDKCVSGWKHRDIQGE